MAKVKCPSCLTEVEHQDAGEKIVCVTCGGSFTFTPASEAQLAGVGEFDQLKKKVGELEAGQAELRQHLGQPGGPAADPAPESPAEGPEEDTDDEEEL